MSMSSERPRESDSLAPYRPRLLGLAYRMLGSKSDADDVLQDAYLRFTEAQDVRNPEAFLVTVVTRLCLDRLKSARARREVYVGPWLPEPIVDAEAIAGCGDRTGGRSVVCAPARARPAVAAGARRSCCTTCSTCPLAMSRGHSIAPKLPVGSLRRGRGRRYARSALPRRRRRNRTPNCWRRSIMRLRPAMLPGLRRCCGPMQSC